MSAAAVAAKPAVNWESVVLTTDKRSNLIAKTLYTLGWFDKYLVKAPVP